MRYFAEGEMCKAKCARRISGDKALFTSYVSLCETASSAPVRALNVIKLRILHSVKKYPPPFLRGGYFTFWLIHIYEEYSIKNHFSVALE